MTKQDDWEKEDQRLRAFRITGEEKKMDSCVVRFNKEERHMLESGKKIIKQKKDSTALKQLATIGAIVLHDKKMAAIIDIVFNNSRKNERTGIGGFE